LNWQAFTPFQSAAGGILIGLSALWMLAAHGRITGISGILGGLVSREQGDRGWRAAFVLGLLVAGVLGTWLAPASLESALDRSTGVTVLAGLLVGFGTRLGSGCTSGHGICGIGRLSVRSLLATGTFMLTGVVTVWLFNLLSKTHG